MLRRIAAGLMVVGTAGLVWSLFSIPQITERKGPATVGLTGLSDVMQSREVVGRAFLKAKHPVDVEEDAWSFGADAIPNEAVVVYHDVAQLEEIQELSRSLGFSIVATIDELGYARLRGTGSAFSALAERGYEIDGNYEVGLPPVSEDELSNFLDHDLIGFESGVLQFLGIPQDNSEWGAGVRVAVLDTGVADHPALAGAHIRSTDLVIPSLGGLETYGDTKAVAAQSIERPDPGRGGMDENGHGTAVVYQLVGRDGYDTGVVPEIEVLSLRILDEGGRGDTFTLAKGVMAAVQEDVHIINLSLGTHRDSPVLHRAIRFADGKGILMVAAAGNDGTADVAYPASYPEVVSVAAVDARDRRAPFSNFGKVDVSAPGFGLPSAWLDESYVYLDGTSGATPLVTGAVARLISRDPTLTPEEIREILATTSNDLGRPGHDPFHGAGRIDVARMERRDIAGIYDLAITDFVFSGDSASAVSIGLLVGMQNRGTEAVENAGLRIHFGDELVADEVVNLGVNEVYSVRVLVPMLLLREPEGLVIQAEAFLPEGFDDARLFDNLREEKVVVTSATPVR